jgi:hypothetical protein
MFSFKERNRRQGRTLSRLRDAETGFFCQIGFAPRPKPDSPQTLAILKRQFIARINQIKRQIAELEEAALALLRTSPRRVRALDILCSISGPAPARPRMAPAWGRSQPSLFSSNARDRLHDPKTDRQPRGPRTNDPAIGPVARQGIHSGRAQVPAQCALHAAFGLDGLQ